LKKIFYNVLVISSIGIGDDVGSGGVSSFTFGGGSGVGDDVSFGSNNNNNNRNNNNRGNGNRNRNNNRNKNNQQEENLLKLLGDQARDGPLFYFPQNYYVFKCFDSTD
jgi:hypothetical protein